MEITARPRRRGGARALTVVLAAACVACVVLLVPPALGYGTHVVGDDAMDGSVPRGSVVLDERLAPGELLVGDVVTLTPPGGGDLVVRRVLSIEDGDVRTGGDATGADPWVVPESATERVALSLPGLGWPLLAVDAVSVPPWAPAALALALALLLLGLRRAGRAGPAGPRSSAAGRIAGVSATQPAPPAG